MQVLKPGISPDALFEKIQTAPANILMLDYDGTLAPFNPDRARAFPYPGVRERLDKLMHNDRTQLVIVSGRQSADLVPLLGLSSPPEMFGCHGGEHFLPAGDSTFVTLSDRQKEAIDDARRWTERENLTPYCELKPLGLAFHWRGKETEQADDIRQRVVSQWADCARECQLMLHEFDGGIELRPSDITKARAVEWLIRVSEPGTPLAYLGDDLTDEDAFEAVGEQGLKAMVRSSLRTTLADILLEPPNDLLDFLDRWLKSSR
ncbi:MAG: trehalose-phosphatase [Candidatus Zixiibacteriota bacterium]